VLYATSPDLPDPPPFDGLLELDTLDPAIKKKYMNPKPRRLRNTMDATKV